VAESNTRHLPVLLAAFIVLIGVACCGGKDSGRETALVVETSPEARQLAEMYSPVLYLVGQSSTCDTDLNTDPYEPVGVDVLLDNRDVRLMKSNFLWLDTTVTAAPALADLVNAKGGEFLDVLKDSHPRNKSQTCSYEQAYRRAPGERSVYARVVSSEDRVALQYWFFYYFDDWVGNRHEGDWEMIQILFRAASAKVIVDKQLAPERADYSQHTGGSWRTWDAVERSPKGSLHPVVYVGAGSHANYFESGYWQAVVSPSIFVGCDAASGVNALGLGDPAHGRPLRAGTYQMPPLLASSTNASGSAGWLRFQGKWGELSVKGFSGLPSLQYQTQGRDPWKWEEGLSDSHPERCVLTRGGQRPEAGADRINAGERITKTFKATVGSVLIFLITWEGSEVSLTLETPAGNMIDPAIAAPNVAHEKGPNYEVYRIVDAASGDWQMLIDGTSLPHGPELVTWEAINVPPTCDYVKVHPGEDTDLDGLRNADEMKRSPTVADPCSWDSDGDGIGDAQELSACGNAITSPRCTPVPTPRTPHKE
jgi:hypothetical protein